MYVLGLCVPITYNPLLDKNLIHVCERNMAMLNRFFTIHLFVYFVVKFSVSDAGLSTVEVNNGCWAKRT